MFSKYRQGATKSPRKSIKSVAVHSLDQTPSANATPSVDSAQANSLSPGLFAIPGLCCLGLCLFLIASTIILSLIPLYLSTRDISVTRNSETVTFFVTLSNGEILGVGDLNADQIAVLQTKLQAELDKNPRTRGSTIRIISATAVAESGRRKRQSASTASLIRVVATITASISVSIRQTILNILNQFIVDVETVQQLENLSATTTTTASNNINNQSRTLIRRSLEEGGAPAGILYIDGHELTGSTGNVTSVSFYVDQTCAMATVEFGAFDLMDRNLEVNKAKLMLTHSSSPLKLDDKSELKPYMNLITIQLCPDKLIDNTNNSTCQGKQFPVLSHQYLGIRSDTCRLGFAPTPNNPVFATTWKLADEVDPFAHPYQEFDYIASDYTVLQSVTINPSETKCKDSIKREELSVKTAPRVLFLGSYPPRQCGLAQFLQSLTENYPGPYNVIAVDESGAESISRNYSNKVIYRLNQTDRNAYFTVADIVNSGTYDVINVQHEYGLFGGMAGEYVLNLLISVRKPVITTFHTIPSKPNKFYMSVTRTICIISTRVIVLSNYGRRLLIDVYGVDENKISFIPHGVPDRSFTHSSLTNVKTQFGFQPNTPVVTTFGLIHRNKNIELALKALQMVINSTSNFTYLVIGQTHPLIKAFEGETYRRELEDKVVAFNLSNNVRFINKFMSDDELLIYLNITDIFLTPYSIEDQYVSGTLSWAVGLGKCVISTPYLYAKELLSNDRGFLIPFNDHQSLSSLFIKLFKDRKLSDKSRRRAYTFGRRMTWPVVAVNHQNLFRQILSSF